MQEFNDYSDAKQLLIKDIKRIKEKILSASNYNINLDYSELTAKLDTIEENIKSKDISIVLTGGFSNGKTSLLAGWFKAPFDEMSDIKKEESTKQIKKYEIKNLPEKCYIVDTPGLFGHKELENNHQTIKYDDITKKYIDEANLILYVMDVKNPVKNSHIPTLQWLFQDLQKFDYTIFIINKMDLVCDITDEASFQSKSEIAIEDFKNRIKDILSLSDKEVSSMNIVTVAANPEDKDFKQWFSYYNIYEERSHIKNFKQMINHVLSNTSREKLIIDAGFSGIKSILSNIIEQIELTYNSLKDNNNKLIEQYKISNNMYKECINEIMDYRQSLFDKLKNYENNLINRVNIYDIYELQTFLEKEIGVIDNDGYNQLFYNINKIIKEHFEPNTVYNSTSLKQLIELYCNSANQVDIYKKQYIMNVNQFNANNKNIAKENEYIPFEKTTMLKQFEDVILNDPVLLKKIIDYIKQLSAPIGMIIQAIIDIIINITNKQKQGTLLDQKRKELITTIQNFFQQIYDYYKNDMNYYNIFNKYLLDIQNSIDELYKEHTQNSSILNNMEKYIELLKKEKSEI